MESKSNICNNQTKHNLTQFIARKRGKNYYNRNVKQNVSNAGVLRYNK